MDSVDEKGSGTGTFSLFPFNEKLTTVAAFEAKWGLRGPRPAVSPVSLSALGVDASPAQLELGPRCTPHRGGLVWYRTEVKGGVRDGLY
jgi:hypothetical protein